VIWLEGQPSGILRERQKLNPLQGDLLISSLPRLPMTGGLTASSSLWPAGGTLCERCLWRAPTAIRPLVPQHIRPQHRHRDGRRRLAALGVRPVMWWPFFAWKSSPLAVPIRADARRAPTRFGEHGNRELRYILENSGHWPGVKRLAAFGFI